MKKLMISIILAIFLAVSPLGTLSAAAYTLPVGTEVTAKAVYMVNLETGTVVFERNSEAKMFPASITKLMTALVAMDHITDLNATVTVYDNVIWDLSGTGAAVAGFQPGEIVTYRDLLSCLLIPSSADAANILAIATCGSIPAFVDEMNQKAAALGMEHSAYTNVHGLHDEGEYTTAYDLYLLGMEVLKYKQLTDICGECYYTIPATNMHDERTLETTNLMIYPSSAWYYRRVQGLKTGYTDAAGRNLLSLAEKDGQRYLTVVLGSPVETSASGVSLHHEFDDTEALLRWAFTDLSYMAVATTNKPEAEVKITLCAEADHVMAVPAQDFSAVIPTDAFDSIYSRVQLDVTEQEAPIRKGDHLGTVTYLCAGEEIGTVELVAQQTLERNTFMLIKDRVVGVITSKAFITIFVVLIVLIAGVVLWNVRVNMKRRRLWNSKVRKK